MTHTYDDGEAIWTGDEVMVGGIAEGEVIKISNAGNRLRVRWFEPLFQNAKSEWVDTKDCEMIRRNQ